MLSKRSRVSLAVALASAALITGCAPEESNNTVSDVTPAPDTTPQLSLALAGNAIVEKTDFGTEGTLSSLSQCESGRGIRLRWGNDADEEGQDGYGVLNEDEVVQTEYICHGAVGATGAKGDKGDTGAAGAKGDKGDTGASGAAGADGNSAYFDIKSLAVGSSACSAGGQEIILGLQDSNNTPISSTLEKFNICNAVTTGGGTSDLDAKISQGKALVENAKGYIDSLVSTKAYDDYLQELDPLLAHEESQTLYNALGGLLKLSFDALYVYGGTDYQSFINDELDNFDLMGTTNLTVAVTNGKLTFTGLFDGIEVSSFSFVYAGNETTDTDSVDRFELTNIHLVGNDRHLMLTDEADVSFEVRLAAGSSSLSELEQYADLSTDAAIQDWKDNIQFTTNGNSAITLNLNGIELSTGSSTDPASFQGNFGFSFGLSESESEVGMPVISFDRIKLAGVMRNSQSENLDISLDVKLAPQALQFDQFDTTIEEVEQAALDLTSSFNSTGLPIQLSQRNDWGTEFTTLTIDYAELLNNIESGFSEFGVNAVTVPDFYYSEDIDILKIEVIDWSGSYYDVKVYRYAKDGKNLDDNQYSSWYRSTNDSSSSTPYEAIISMLQGLYGATDFSVYTETGLQVDLSLDFGSSSLMAGQTHLPLQADAWVMANDFPAFESIVFDMSSDVEKDQSFNLSIENLAMNWEYFDGNWFELKGDATLTLNDAIKATFPIWLESTTDSYSYYCEDSSADVYYGSDINYFKTGADFNWCLGENASFGPYRDELKIHFTDNQGAGFDVIFQDRAYDERFNAYVTVEGVSVGKLVQLRDGSYSVEFRDHVRVPLTDN